MTLERAFEILDRFNRCEACDTSDTSFTCQDCDEAFYIALQLLKKQEAMNVDSFVQWCIDNHIMGDATIKGIKYWVRKYKEAAEGVEKHEEAGREPGALQESADHAGRGEDGRGRGTAGDQQDHGEPDQDGGV